MKINTVLFGLLISVFSSLAPAQTAAAATSGAATSEASVSGGSSEGKVNTSKVVSDDPDYFSKSSFGMLFYSLGGYDDTQFKSPDPSFGLYDAYVSFSWRLPNDVRVALLPTFGYNTEGYDSFGNKTTDKFYWRDFSLTVAQNHLLEDFLPAAWDLKQKARLYLPTSDGSKDQGMIARLRLEVETRYNFDRYSNVRIYAKPSYYFQRNKAYTKSSGKLGTTHLIESEHGAEVNWNLNKIFSIKPGFEINEDWENASESNSLRGSHDAEIGYRLGLEIRPNRDMNFTIGIQESHDLMDPAQTPEVGYTLLTNITIM